MFNLIGNGSDWSSSHSGHLTTRTRGSIVCWQEREQVVEFFLLLPDIEMYVLILYSFELVSYLSWLIGIGGRVISDSPPRNVFWKIYMTQMMGVPKMMMCLWVQQKQRISWSFETLFNCSWNPYCYHVIFILSVVISLPFWLFQ